MNAFAQRAQSRGRSGGENLQNTGKKKLQHQVIRETKDSRPKSSLVRCCCLLGITRQAYYQHFWNEEASSFEQEFILAEVRRIRRLQPVIGGRKLYAMLHPFCLNIRLKWAEMPSLTCLLPINY